MVILTETPTSEDGYRSSRKSVVGGVNVQNPPVVQAHFVPWDDETAEEAPECGNKGRNAMSDPRKTACDENEDIDPTKVDQKEHHDDKDNSDWIERLVDYKGDNCHAQSKWESGDGCHTYENMEDEILRFGDAVRIFQSEDLERFDQQSHHHGAHEKRATAAGQTHNSCYLCSNICWMVCSACGCIC